MSVFVKSTRLDAWTFPRLRFPLVLASLAVLAYLPALDSPFISDDYVQIDLARHYGPVSGWALWPPTSSTAAARPRWF